jgi:hypothetical protein
VRLLFSLAIGFGAVCLVYWLLPATLPLWPAVVAIVVAAVVGLLWERKALDSAGLHSNPSIRRHAPALNRNHIAFLASLVALSAVMVISGDLFRWSKVVHPPEWAKALPAPLLLPSYLTFICLLPAAFGSDRLGSACTMVLKSVLWAPFAAVIAYALNPLHQNASLLFNALFHYAWAVLFFCSLPATLVLLIRWAVSAGLGRLGR